MVNDTIDTKNKLPSGESFKISRFKELIKKTKPHKHDDYFELIFLREGEGFHCVEDEKYMISTPVLYFLKPRQVHYWQFTAIPKGFVILFNESEFDRLRENNLIEQIRKLTEKTFIHFTPDNYPDLLLEEMFREFKSNANYSKDIIHGLMLAITGRILRVIEQTNTFTRQAPSIYDHFTSLLIKECQHLHKVNEFANLLHTTPQNLNTICRKQTGKSASQLISNQLLLEAKRYILHTDKTISEIAEVLSFTDSSNFVKFFKSHTKQTPVQFRNQYFQ